MGVDMVRRRWDRWIWPDLGVAVAVATVWWLAIVDPPGPAVEIGHWWGVPVVLLGTLTIVGRRTAPAAVLVVVCGTLVVGIGLGTVGAGVLWISGVPTAMALYTIAERATLTRAVTGVAGAVPAVAVAVWILDRRLPSGVEGSLSEVSIAWPAEAVFVTGALAASWTAGRLVLWRREVLGQVVRHENEAAVNRERLRIARELHDALGHSMSVIAVKASVANHIADARPDQARQAMRVIESTSQNALSDIRLMLGTLRSGELDPAMLRPQAGVDQLPRLVEGVEQLGIDVEVDVASGVLDGLSAPIDLAVYRIVQEALTNVVKHSGADRCRVEVAVDEDAVRATVLDNGSLRQRQRSVVDGHGLVGMRERVKLFGGTFRAGPADGGGFEVRAVIPHDVGMGG